MRLGTLSDASKMTKREASWYIDELLNKSAYSEYRVGGEAFQRLVREQDTLRMLNNVRMSGVRGGKPPTELKVRKQSTADKYNELSKKYRLGVTYKVRNHSEHR